MKIERGWRNERNKESNMEEIIYQYKNADCLVYLEILMLSIT
jgi:hypothetical protein